MIERIRRMGTGAALVALLVTPAAWADSDLWLHVRVDEANGAKVSVNLPIGLVEKAIPMIPTEHFQDGHLVIDHDVEWSIADLRELWAEVRNSRDMTFVTVEDGDDNVKVWKEAGYLRVRVLEEGDGEAEVNVKIPERVVDALLGGDGEQLDLSAALAALVDEGEGELVTVNDDRDRVRVWVDRVAEAE